MGAETATACWLSCRVAATPLLPLLQIKQGRETGTMEELGPVHVEPDKTSQKVGPAKASKQQESAMKFM